MRPAQFPAAVFSGTPAALCHPVSPCVTPPIAAASKMLLGDMKLVGRALCLPQPLCLPPPLPRSSSPGGHQPRGHPGATKRMPALFPGAEDDIARGGGIFGQQSPSPPQRAGFRIEPSCAAAAPQLSQPQAWVTSASGGGGRLEGINPGSGGISALSIPYHLLRDQDRCGAPPAFPPQWNGTALSNPNQKQLHPMSIPSFGGGGGRGHHTAPHPRAPHQGDTAALLRGEGGGKRPRKAPPRQHPLRAQQCLGGVWGGPPQLPYQIRRAAPKIAGRHLCRETAAGG